MDDLEPLESRFPAPGLKVRARIIEGVAELDQHVERHQQPEKVLAPRVVDERLDRYKSAARLQSLYGVKTTGGEIITGMAVNNYVVSKPPDEAWSTGITYEKLRASMFVLTIQRDGTVADVKAVQGTGYRELDERAARWFKKWRFQPNSVVEARMPFGYFQRRR